MSGFSDQAWGSRSVTVGHDVPASAWAAAVDAALESFPTNPFVLQEFKDAALVEHPYWDPQTGERKVMRGRVRLCPYYFTPVGATRPAPVLGGVLATIAPADKKLIHGMRDAILVPCTVRNDG